MKKIYVENGEVKLCLFAIRDIEVNEEIVYDYSDSALEWRSKTWTPRPIYQFWQQFIIQLSYDILAATPRTATEKVNFLLRYYQQELEVSDY